jgi:class 3 adenylate cyclase
MEEQCAVLFADIQGFSHLEAFEVSTFVEKVLGQYSRWLDNLPNEDKPVVRNTWGDAIFLIFKLARPAADCALSLRDLFKNMDWRRVGIHQQLKIRIALHNAYATLTEDPITSRLNAYGSHINMAARLEPVALPNEIFATKNFKEALTLHQSPHQLPVYAWDDIGEHTLAKDWGKADISVLRRRGENAFEKGQLITKQSLISADRHFPMLDSSQNESYRRLADEYRMSEYYKSGNGGKAIFYHYSGVVLRQTALDLFHHGYEIKIFVQDPSVSQGLGCAYQSDRINKSLGQYRTEFRNGGRSGNGKIHIYKSKAPLTVRGALVDDKWAVIGWYVYGVCTEHHPPHTDFPEDIRNLIGDDIPLGLFLSDQHPDFGLIRSFFQDYEERIAVEPDWSSE